MKTDHPQDSHGLPRGLARTLTYRTARVLAAIAANPGCSNRAVADVAEIADRGQASKLLARLRRLGLIETTGDGPLRGGANAWRLTPQGELIEQSLRVTS